MKIQSLINGKWIDRDDRLPNINPSDLADVVGEYAPMDEACVVEAVASAQAASHAWGMSPIQQRHDVLKKAGDILSARSSEIGTTLAREEGKTLAEAVAETRRAAQIFQFFAGECLRSGGEYLPSVRPDINICIAREPVGVVAIITPWNFPIAIPAWKIAPALAWGNTVVFKPAELVPASAWLLVSILQEAGLPDGVLNMVIGTGPVVGQAMLCSRGIDAYSFTGSMRTGQLVATAAAQNLSRVQLEMGGKNPLIILDDADLGPTVECAINGAFFSTGQRCTASSRLIVTDGIHDQFIDAMSNRMRALRVGHALDPQTDIGPVVDERQLEQNLQYIEIAKAEGGKLLFGGEMQRRDTEGHFLTPALFVDTNSAMRVNREEIFGPVASVIRVRHYDDALAVANDSEFGLTAGICTTSLKYASHFKRHAQAGMTMVNLPTAGVDYHVPFGGCKGSSLGQREQGSHAREFYSSTKTSYEFAGA
ncbi:MAG: aldehyde dehydrogenase family protein [Sphingopyxis sp.]|nr:aldehyde dehydrogenase family protein [Sphingopyxis sp.]